MALQTFSDGDILTAAKLTGVQNNAFNQTVSTKTDSYTLVALDKGPRVVMNKATATTITVNTSLFNAGDTLFIQNIGAGTCTITAGTATVTTAGSLALAQWGGGTLYFTSASAAIFFSGARAALSVEALIIAGGGGGNDGGNGGSGVVIFRYPSAYTITIGAGLTGSTSTVGSNKVTTITAGTGSVQWN